MVDHVRHVLHINAPGSNVGRNQQGTRPVSERLEPLAPLILVEVPVDCPAFPAIPLDKGLDSCSLFFVQDENENAVLSGTVVPL